MSDGYGIMFSLGIMAMFFGSIIMAFWKELLIMAVIVIAAIWYGCKKGSYTKKALFLVITSITLTGCARFQIATPKAVVLEDDKIYTLKAGQTVGVVRDGKDMEITFSNDKVIVSPNTINDYEKKACIATQKQVKAEASKSKILTVLGGISTFAGGLGSVWAVGRLKGVFKKGDVKS